MDVIVLGFLACLENRPESCKNVAILLPASRVTMERCEEMREPIVQRWQRSSRDWRVSGEVTCSYGFNQPKESI